MQTELDKGLSIMMTLSFELLGHTFHSFWRIAARQLNLIKPLNL